MASTSTGQLSNNLARTDKTSLLRKVYRNRISATNLKYTKTEYDTTGIFITGVSITGGPDITLGSGGFPSLPTTTVVWNDNDEYQLMFTHDLDLDTSDWTFNYSGGQVTTTTNDIVSDYIAKDSTKSWTSATVEVSGELVDFTTNYSLTLTTDSGDVSASWSGTTTFSGTTSLKYKISNDATGETLDMFDQEGRPMIIKIRYS